MQKYYSCDKNNSAKIKKQGMQNNETENDAFRYYS